MAWIEVHQALVNHRKTMRLAALLRCQRAQVVGHLVCLWLWAIDNADENGLLANATAAEIAMAAEWEKQAETFMSALAEAGFAEQRDAGVIIHDWPEYGGRMARLRARNAERMQRARATHVQRTEHARAANVQRTQRERAEPSNANVQDNSTQQYTTQHTSSLNDAARDDDDEDHDPAWRDRYGTIATAIGIVADQRMADEISQLADEFSLEQLQKAVRECRSSNKRPWPSELRKHLPQIRNGRSNEPYREPEFKLPEVVK